MITITIYCPHCESDALVRNGRARERASSNISAVPVIDKAEKIRLRMPTPTNARGKSCEPMKSGAVCAGWSEHLDFHTTRSSHGSKKAAELAPLSETVMAPDITNPDSTILELDELWFFVANKTNHAWDLDRFVQKEPKSWPPMPLEIAAKPPAAVGGGHSTCLRYRSLLHRFLERAYQAVIPEEQQTAVGKETGETERAGTLEQYAPTTLGSLMARKTLSFSK
jgi:hypothetical protein